MSDEHHRLVRYARIAGLSLSSYDAAYDDDIDRTAPVYVSDFCALVSVARKEDHEELPQVTLSPAQCATACRALGGGTKMRLRDFESVVEFRANCITMQLDGHAQHVFTIDDKQRKQIVTWLETLRERALLRKSKQTKLLKEVERLQKRIKRLERPLLATEMELARLDRKHDLGLDQMRTWRFEDEIRKILNR